MASTNDNLFTSFSVSGQVLRFAHRRGAKGGHICVEFAGGQQHLERTTPARFDHLGLRLASREDFLGKWANATNISSGTGMARSSMTPGFAWRY